MMEAPRWLADEMLGRLARYLRFLGYDTAYARGEDDSAVAERAQREKRTLLTRDRALARKVPGAIRLHKVSIREQLVELQSAFPALRSEVRFDRCTRCNGRLEPLDSPFPDGQESRSPPPAGGPATPVFRCALCDHRYWEGSHTAQVRARIRQWLGADGSHR